MAITTTQTCDKCQSEISEESGRPGFPQMSWCFFRKGLQILTNAVTGEYSLQNAWFGQVNRTEFCQGHGQEINVLLKAYLSADPRLVELLVVLSDEDSVNWVNREIQVRDEFDALTAPHEEAAQ